MLNLKLDKDEIYRYLGYQEGMQLTKEIEKLIEDCMQLVLNTINCRTVYSPLLDVINDKDGFKIGIMPLKGEDIRAHLAHCDKGILMAVTLGNQIDALIHKESLLDVTKAVIIDACCNVAVEEVANNLEKELREKLHEKGKYMTGRYSPGYGDMPISSQKDLLNILEAERKIGVTLTATNLMIPKKSITAIMGVADIPVTGKKAGCNHCVMKDKCIYRKRGTTC